MADNTVAPQAFEDAFKALSDLGDKPIPANLLDPAPVVKDEAAQKAEADALAVKAKADADAAAAKTALDKAAAEIIQTPEQKATAEAAVAQTPEEKAAAEAETVAAKAKSEADAAQAASEAAQVAEDDRLARFARAVRGDQQQDDQRTRTVQPEPLFTADDAKFVAGFEKDWPDVARAMVLQQKAMMRNIPDYVFRSIAAEFGPRLSMLEGLAERAQYQDLTGTVPDYDDIRDKVIDWAAKQPAYLQEPFNRVIQEGTVDEIADLIQRYRKDTGTAAPSAQQTIQAKPPAQDELSTTAKQAAAKLAPVSTKRSGAVTVAPQDFDGAFAEFSKAS